MVAYYLILLNCNYDVGPLQNLYDNVYSSSDVTEKELLEFIDSMSHSQLQEVQKYLNDQPVLKHTVKFTCKHDGHENEIELKGIASFF